MSQDKTLSANDKAAALNKDSSVYGSFAEIGAGQETARCFFRAGYASGTIAKTMSAYDMTFSDAIYGAEANGRYVVESRLIKMLDKEYDLLEKRLGEQRGDSTRFFAFSNTVAAKSKKVPNGHGWVGVRFQTQPLESPSEIVIHVRLLDPRNYLQQETLGQVGVNLVYGANTYYEEPRKLIGSLADGIGTERIEIDMIRMSGPAFENVDNRLMSLHLVELGLSKWALFGPKKSVIQPAEALYHKNVLIQRGSFRPVTNLNLDMLECGLKQYSTDYGLKESDVLVLMEITLSNLKRTAQVDIEDFLNRVDVLSNLGHHILITNYPTIPALVRNLREQHISHLGLVMNYKGIEILFQEGRFNHLSGGMLEAMGHLFDHDSTVYIYPSIENAEMKTTKEFTPDTAHIGIYRYLLSDGKIRDLTNFNRECIGILSADVMAQIQSGDQAWEKSVPAQVSKLIKENQYFGYTT